eukprot:481991_1
MTALTKEYSAIHDLLSAGFTQEEATNAVALSMETYDTEDQYKCVCGNYFTKIIIIATENIRDATIGCNLCRLRGKKNDIFWHCYPNKCHDGSFDGGCYEFDKIVSANLSKVYGSYQTLLDPIK